MLLSITCHYRSHARCEHDEGSLYLRVIYQRVVGSLTLPLRIRSDEWDNELKRPVIPQGKGHRSDYLHRVHVGISQARERLLSIAYALEEQGRLNVKNLLNSYRLCEHRNSLKALATHLSGELEQEGRYRTSRAYRTSARRFLSFVEKEDCGAGELTNGLLRRYETYLRSEALSLHTISFYIRNLRAMYNKGVKLGYFSGLHGPAPFGGLYTGIPKTEKRALETTDLRKLDKLLVELYDNTSDVGVGLTAETAAVVSPVPPETAITENPAFRASLELFLFAFHAQGMSFVDLAHVKKEDLKENQLIYLRHKTGQRVRVVLTPEARQLLNRLRSRDENSPYLFSLIKETGIAGYRQYCSALKNQNVMLKQVAQKAGIAPRLSTHMARHSWATIAKRENIPIGVISESLGHSSVATTSIYLDSFNASTIAKANRKVSGSIRRSVAV